MKKCYLCIASAAVGAVLALTYVTNANQISMTRWMTGDDLMIQLYLGKVAMVPYVLGMAFIGWVAASKGWKNALVAAAATFVFFVLAGTIKQGPVPAVPPMPEVFAMLAVFTILIAEAAKWLYSKQQAPQTQESANTNNA